jgi:hypothetical protein
LNGVRVDPEARQKFIEQFLIVHVPPIRDIAVDGLDPFKKTLAEALRNTRGTQSFANLADAVRNAVEEKGGVLLGRARDLAKSMLKVDELAVDASGLDLELLLLDARLKVRVDGYDVGMDKLGTGHQSSVIIQLYRQVGASSEKCVIYLFEEPDNHLHPSSMRTIATALLECSQEADAQVFLTTHSPHLINQFDLKAVIALHVVPTVGTQQRQRHIQSTDRQIRITLGKFGLRPAEALLAEKVIVVEGPNDVTVVRTLIGLKAGQTVDELDYLIIPAGGKDQVAKLCLFLNELGVNWWAVFDCDAADSTSVPHFTDGLSHADISNASQAITTLEPLLNTMPTRLTGAQKLLAAMTEQLINLPPRSRSFAGSVLEVFITTAQLLNQQERVKLKKAIDRRQVQVLRGILSPVRIWLWSGVIEEVVAHNVAAENEIETLLRNRGLISQNFPSNAVRKPVLLKRLKDLAHEPLVMEEIVTHLWNTGRLNGSRAKAAAKDLTQP